MRLGYLIVCVLAVSCAFGERRPFDRYQSIVDRQMFGPLPPGFDPSKSPSEVQKTSSAQEKQLSQAQEKLKSSIHFSVINVMADGSTVVGFTDKSDPKMPLHYYLKVGEERNGWLVKEANADDATMTIAKGEIEVSLRIGGDSARDDAATSKSSAPRGAGGKGVLGSGFGSLRSRRQARMEKKRQELAKEKQEREEQAAAQAQREAERQARAEEEKRERDAERAEQRKQLQAIQEELKRVREQRKQEGAGGEGNGDNEAQ